MDGGLRLPFICYYQEEVRYGYKRRNTINDEKATEDSDK